MNFSLQYKSLTPAFAFILVISTYFISTFVNAESTSGKPSQSSSAIEATDQKKSLIQWHPWTDSIFEQAEKSNKMLLVDVSAVWCAYCKKMDETTYRDPEIVKIINEHFLPIRVKDGDPITPAVDRFKDFATPTTAIFNTQGEQIIAKTGYLKPQWMNWMLQAVVADPTPEANTN